MNIVWTPRARLTYFNVLDHLEQAWTNREIQNFINEVGKFLEQRKQNPEMFQESSKHKNVRKAIISKHNTLYYRVKPRKREIQLLLFWDNRQDPGERPY